MTINDFSSYIVDILKKNNIIVVPNFGAFELKNIPSKYNFFEQKIYPPTKKLYFNRTIIQDDENLFVNKISSYFNTDFNTGKKLISDKVKEIENILDKNKKINLTKIGIIRIGINKEFFFHSEYEKINRKYSDLDTINMEPVEGKNILPKIYNNKKKKKNYKPTIKVNQKQNEIKQKPIIYKEKKILRKEKIIKEKTSESFFSSFMFKLILTLILFIFLVYSSWFFTKINKVDLAKFKITDYFNFSKYITKTKKYTEKDIDIELLEDKKNIEVKNNKKNHNKKQINKEKYINSINYNISKKRGYHVIVGSFKNKSNAYKSLKKFTKDGFTTRIIIKNNAYLISAGNSKSKIKIRKILKNIKKKHPAWVLLK